MRPRCSLLQLCVSALVSLLAASIAPPAHASLSVLLEEPYGWFSHLSPSGHTAIYLNQVCADTPLHLRPCLAGELGVVISRYHGVGDHDWIAVPLTGYLYAVPTTHGIPPRVTAADVAALREAYRREFLTPVAPTLPDDTAPPGNWYELAGASFDRTIYGFQVKTTSAQDSDLIAFLNDKPNHQKFNGVTRNCADFVRLTVNHLYPHAIGRNYVAGLGVSSPKSVARSLSHHANKHRELDFRTFRITQVPGPLPRSHPAVTLMEGVTREFGPPLLIAAPVVCPILCPLAAGVAATAWLTQGRFPEPADAPELDLASLPYSPGTVPLPQGSPRNTSP